MTRERWSRIGNLFDVVADLPAARRAERLAAACRGTPGLRREVEALLRADRAADGGAFIRRVVAFEVAGLAVLEAGAAAREVRPRPH